MTVIQNTTLQADGNPVQVGLVTVALVDSLGQQVTGYLADSTIVRSATTHTDASGDWSLDLTPNASITPANTYYLVSEPSGVSTVTRHLIEVPGSGPQDLTDVLVTTPAALGSLGDQETLNAMLAAYLNGDFQQTIIPDREIFDFAATAVDTLAATAATAGPASANDCIYSRVFGKTVTTNKVTIYVGTSSGNISVGVYSSTGTGRSRIPATRKATTGTIACPGTGEQEVTLTTTTDISPGDYIGISADNTTAKFGRIPAPTYAEQGKGRVYKQSTAHPAPATAASLTATSQALLAIADNVAATFDITLNPAVSTSGWSLETTGFSTESITVVSDHIECIAGGVAGSTHYARIRRKLPENDLFAANDDWILKANMELKADFYTQKEGYTRILGTDNFPAAINGITYGAGSADEWRVALYYDTTESKLKLASAKENQADALVLWTDSVAQRIVAGAATDVELRFTPSKTTGGSWEVLIGGASIDSDTGVQTVPTSVADSEMYVTRIVAGIDGAYLQDTKTLQNDIYSIQFTATR